MKTPDLPAAAVAANKLHVPGVGEVTDTCGQKNARSTLFNDTAKQ